MQRSKIYHFKIIKEKSIAELEAKVRSAEMKIPKPVNFGLLQEPERKRLPSRARTALGFETPASL